VLENSDAENYSLRKEKVEIGRVSTGFTEIISTEELTNVIIQGVYNLSVE
jgi:cobalt-zinc-cadmium efflux system membrane fusion protein